MVHFIVLKGGAKNYLLYLFGFQRIIAQPLFATMHCYHFSLVVRGALSYVTERDGRVIYYHKYYSAGTASAYLFTTLH